MNEVFISYSSKDEQYAEDVARQLQEKNILVFRAPTSVPGGARFKLEIRKALRECAGFFLLLTPNSLDNEWVKLEYSAAYVLEKHIVPILLNIERDSLQFPLNEFQAVEFFELPRVIDEFKSRPKTRSSLANEAPEVSPAQFVLPTIIEAHVSSTVNTLGDLVGSFDEALQVPEDESVEAVEIVENRHFDPSLSVYPTSLKGRIMIDTIHAGNTIPGRFWPACELEDERHQDIESGYIEEKDWGANYLAAGLARALNLEYFYQIKIARILMDYGRLPGVTEQSRGHLDRFAINYPFLETDHSLKKDLLESYYDDISSQFERAVEGKVLKLAVHTYDKYNPSGDGRGRGTERPEVSIVYSSASYHEHKRMTHGLFDPLFPDELGQHSADRRLAARISLELEKEGIMVAHDHPYMLPDGSVEMRAQAWQFFIRLREIFETSNPDTKNDPSYRLVWEMLKDTNRRSSVSNLLRSYIHRYRRIPDEILIADSEAKDLFRHDVGSNLDKARIAYESVAAFFRGERRARIIDDYRWAKDRPSALVIEVRKDILWRFHDDECREPELGEAGLKLENLETITMAVSRALLKYLNMDQLPVPRRNW